MRGANIPLLVDATSSIADELGAEPVEFIAIPCPYAAFTESKKSAMTTNDLFLKNGKSMVPVYWLIKDIHSIPAFGVLQIYHILLLTEIVVNH